MRCKYSNICKHYRKDSFTCNADLTDKERSYCGAFRMFEDKKIVEGVADAVSQELEKLMQTPNIHEDWKAILRDMFKGINSKR